MLRRILKATAERVLTAEPITRLAQRRRVGSTLILAYHNIVPRGERAIGDSSLHLPQDMFARQLDQLLETHEVVGLEQALDCGDDSRRPRVVITFDDATQGAVTAGVLELRRRSLPATLFIAPAFVGGRPFWWDAVEQSGGGEPDTDMRHLALIQLGGSDAAVREWAAAQGLQIVEPPAHQLCATEEQLRQVAGPDITFGSHTWSHPNLTTLSPESLSREMAQPLQWLNERFDNVVQWLAYPYGLCNARVAAAARSAGYTGALRVDGGWLTRPDHDVAERHMLPRYNIPAGLSLRGFRLRTSGLFG